MTLEDYFSAIASSDPHDWTRIHRPTFLQDLQQISGGGNPVPWIEVEEHDLVLSFRKDLAISVASGLLHTEDFQEPWARKFPDPHASSNWIDFLYNGVPIFRDITVVVDGGRASLPNTVAATTDVPRRKREVWRAMSGDQAKFDEYFHRAGLNETSQNWPR